MSEKEWGGVEWGGDGGAGCQPYYTYSTCCTYYTCCPYSIRQCRHALQLHQDGVLLQVKGQQDGVSDIQAVAGEVGLGLVWLQTAQGGKLRLARRSFHDAGRALLAKVVPEQTTSKETKASTATTRQRVTAVGEMT